MKSPLEVAEDLTGPGLRPWIFGSQSLLRSFEEEGQGQPNTGSPGQCVLLYDVGKSKVEEGNLGEQDLVVPNAAVLEVELAGCVYVMARLLFARSSWRCDGYLPVGLFSCKVGVSAGTLAELCEGVAPAVGQASTLGSALRKSSRRPSPTRRAAGGG